MKTEDLLIYIDAFLLTTFCCVFLEKGISFCLFCRVCCLTALSYYCYLSWVLLYVGVKVFYTAPVVCFLLVNSARKNTLLLFVIQFLAFFIYDILLGVLFQITICADETGMH